MNRHLKKYYFYFLARLLDLLGQYDKSFANFAKVIRFRTFLWDVQSRYVAAYQKSSKNFSIELHGGIGDFLQHLPFILKNKSAHYIVVTHYEDAPKFFASLDIKVNQFYFYSNLGEYRVIREKLKHLTQSYICPRSLFFDRKPFKTQIQLNLKKKFIIGIHAGASKLGANKAISKEFIQALIKNLLDSNYKIILFGTCEEIKQLNISPNENLLPLTSKKITDSLSLVSNCNFFVGSDSVFKTMASMLKIPTIVFCEDNRNNFRDRVFIKPYLNHNVMHVYKYKKLQGVEVRKAIQYVSEICRVQFEVHNKQLN
jgi:ADP-heptose:LPS heptosyltransferase